MTLSHSNRHVEHHGSPPQGLSLSADGFTLVPEGAHLLAKEPQEFSFHIETDTGGVVEDFEEEQGGVEIHLIVVRRDLIHFQHLHPTMSAGGTWSTPLELPAPGVYRAFVDFQIGGTPRTLGVDLFAPGDVSAYEAISPSRQVEVGGYQVMLDAEATAAGVDTALTFHVSQGSRPVTDLQPYLDALGHLVVLRSGDLAYLHAHPTEAVPEQGLISFHSNYPSAGRYGLFLQFQHRERVQTAALGMDVSPMQGSG
jgi:hypothetical protein